MRHIRFLLLASSLASLCGCSETVGSSDNLHDGMFTDEEWKKVTALSGLPDKPPTDTTNKYAENEAAAAFGQKLFYSRAYAGPIITGDNGSNGGLGAAGDTGKIACSDCHSPPWFIDTRTKPAGVTLGADWIPRNTPALVNIAYLKGFHDWEGISDSLWVDGLGGAQNPAFVDTDRLTIAHGLYKDSKDEFNNIFDEKLDPDLDPTSANAARFPAAGGPKADPSAPDGAWEKMAPADQTIISRTFVNYGKAIAAFLTKITSNNAPFDKYVAGDTTAISESAKRGLKLFVGKATCTECHKGPTLSDEKFHNTTRVSKYAPEVTPGSQQLWDALNGFFEQGHEAGLGYALSNPLNRDSEFSDDTTTDLLKTNTNPMDATLLAAYRTSPLRNIAETAPYMHDGGLATLEDVMKFYNDGGTQSGFQGTKDEKMKKLNLSDDEVKDVIEFLKTLTGDPVDASLTHG